MKVTRISVTVDTEMQGGNVSKMTIRPDRIVGLVELTSGHVIISVEDAFNNISSWYIEEDYEEVFKQIESFVII